MNEGQIPVGVVCGRTTTLARKSLNQFAVDLGMDVLLRLLDDTTPTGIAHPEATTPHVDAGEVLNDPALLHDAEDLATNVEVYLCHDAHTKADLPLSANLTYSSKARL